MRDVRVQLFNGADTDATMESDAFAIQQNFKLSGQVISTDPGGNIDGSLQLWVSNDQAPAGNNAPFTPTNWSAFGSAITVDQAEVQLIPAVDICYRWIKGVYTDNSAGASTGLLTVNIEMQGV